MEVVREPPTGDAWTQSGFEPMSWVRVVSGVAMRQGGVARRLLTRVASSAHPWHSSKPWGDAAVRAIANTPPGDLAPEPQGGALTKALSVAE